MDLSELVGQSACFLSRSGSLEESELSDIIDMVIHYRRSGIGIAPRALSKIVVLEYHRANQLAELLVG